MIVKNVPKANSGFPIVADSGREILEIDVDMYCRKRTSCRKYTDADLVRMRVLGGATFDILAKMLGVTRERVRQRIWFALRDAERAQVLTTGVVRR